MKKCVFSFIVITIVFIGCKHDLSINPESCSTTSGGLSETICSPDSVYFQEQILPLFQSNCASPGCHDPITAEEGFVFNSYEGIMASGEISPGDLDDGDIFEVITEDDPDKIMPPPSETPLSAEQISLISDWILQGAQNNSCPSLNCDTTNVTFAASVGPLIASSCSGCHSGTAPSANLNLVTYEEIADIAQNGILMDALLGTGSIPLMPYNTQGLEPCSVRIIEIWIENGAEND